MADAVTHSVVNLHAFGSHYSMCSSGSQCKNDVQSSSETQFWSVRGRQGSFSLAVVVVGPCIRVQPRVGPPRSHWLCNPSPELPIGRWETSPRTGARPLPVFALRAFAPSPPTGSCWCDGIHRMFLREHEGDGIRHVWPHSRISLPLSFHLFLCFSVHILFPLETQFGSLEKFIMLMIVCGSPQSRASARAPYLLP